MPRFIIHLIVILFSAAAFMGAAWFLLWYYFREARKMKGIMTQPDEAKIILPIRLQAYERTVLFLERIMPANLVMRIQKPEMNALQLQSALIKAIREEFDYNLSQQLYLSVNAWELVKNAKEETIKMINLASGKVSETASSAELVRTIMEMVVAADKLPAGKAIEAIRKEVQREF